MPGGGKLNSSPLRREQFVFQGGYVEIIVKKSRDILEKTKERNRTNKGRAKLNNKRKRRESKSLGQREMNEHTKKEKIEPRGLRSKVKEKLL